jgi:hypothetical protein
VRFLRRLLVVWTVLAAIILLGATDLATWLSGAPLWARVSLAVLGGAAVLLAGVKVLRGFGTPPRETREGEPEEVDALEVYFVCAECGTEYKVTKLGELSVPRHCGEPMQVERRPARDPSLN